MADLTPANANPWYVLATLYGEQKGEEIDWELDARNRRVWNAWACQNMSRAQRAAVAKCCDIDVAETEGWDAIADEVVRLHEKEMLARNGGGFTLPGLPDPSDIIDCSITHFPNKVVFEKRVFDPPASFYSNKFSAPAYFNSTTFNAPATFHSATFNAPADFTSAAFVALADFKSTGFGATATFHATTFSAEADFTSATFSNTATFSSLFSDTATFSFATFNATARFDWAKFKAVTTFHDATFSAAAVFIGATFNDRTSFSSAAFRDAAAFSSAKFSDIAHFDSASFDGPVFFNKSEFGTAERSNPAPVRFGGAQFARPASFRLAKFHQTFPEFSGAILHATTTFTARDGHWPVQIDSPKNPNALIAARESAATIRHAVGKLGLPEDEHYFFRKEMGFARRIGSIWQRLPYIGFGVLSNYGYSIARPMGWLAGLFAAPVPYYTYFFTPKGGATLWWFIDPAQIPGAFGLSFSSIFNFFGFQRSFFRDEIDQFDGVMAVLSGTQTVMGYILLFFLALGLRQRFRLR